MKKTGFILALIAVVIDCIFSGIAAISLLTINGGEVVALITLALLSLEVIAMVQFNKSKGWIIFLLVLGSVGTLLQFGKGVFPLIPVLLVIGSIFGLADKEDNNNQTL